MKLSTPGLLMLGVAGLAVGTVAGFAAASTAARDPEGTRRLVRRVVREASRGLEEATRLVAEAREQFGDLVAEAREEVREERRASADQAARRPAGDGRRRPARRSAAAQHEARQPDAGTVQT